MSGIFMRKCCGFELTTQNCFDFQNTTIVIDVHSISVYNIARLLPNPDISRPAASSTIHFSEVSEINELYFSLLTPSGLEKLLGILRSSVKFRSSVTFEMCKCAQISTSN